MFHPLLFGAIADRTHIQFVFISLSPANPNNRSPSKVFSLRYERLEYYSVALWPLQPLPLFQSVAVDGYDTSFSGLDVLCFLVSHLDWNHLGSARSPYWSGILMEVQRRGGSVRACSRIVVWHLPIQQCGCHFTVAALSLRL